MFNKTKIALRAICALPDTVTHTARFCFAVAELCYALAKAVVVAVTQKGL